MNKTLASALLAAFFGLGAASFGGAVASASPATNIESDGGSGGNVDRDGTQGSYDRDGTQGIFLEPTEGETRDATQGDTTGPYIVATPGWTSKPAKGF